MRLKVVTVLVTLAAALVGAGCGGGDDKISSDARKDFIKGCTDGGQPQKGCECIFDELEKKGVDTENKFKKLAEDVKKGEISDDFREAALECRDELTTQ